VRRLAASPGGGGVRRRADRRAGGHVRRCRGWGERAGVRGVRAPVPRSQARL